MKQKNRFYSSYETPEVSYLDSGVSFVLMASPTTGNETGENQFLD